MTINCTLSEFVLPRANNALMLHKPRYVRIRNPSNTEYVGLKMRIRGVLQGHSSSLLLNLRSLSTDAEVSS